MTDTPFENTFGQQDEMFDSDEPEASADEIDETGQAEAEQESSGQTAKKSAAKPRRSGKLTKKQVSSVLASRSAVESASDTARTVTAALTGADDADDVDALTVAVVTAERTALKAVESLTALTAIDEQIERVIAVDSWDKPTTASAWRLLRELDLVSSGLPANETKAAAAIAKAADELPDELAEVSELLSS